MKNSTEFADTANEQGSETTPASALTVLGWDAGFSADFALYQKRGLISARIARVNRSDYVVFGNFGQAHAYLPGSFLDRALASDDYPAIGDWVAIEPGARRSPSTKNAVRGLLPRHSAFKRQRAGLSAISRQSQADAVLMTAATTMSRVAL